MTAALRLAARVATPASRAGSFRLLSSNASSERVRVTKGADGVVEVVLSRPEKLNALDIDMFRSIQATADSLIADSSGVRAVVIHGEGRGFCAGLDVKSVMHPLSMTANMEELLHRPEGRVGNLAQDVGYLWRRVPAPVIAVTHGMCLGGGLQIALGVRCFKPLRTSAHPAYLCMCVYVCLYAFVRVCVRVRVRVCVCSLTCLRTCLLACLLTHSLTCLLTYVLAYVLTCCLLTYLLKADMRISSASCKFSVMEAKWGIIPDMYVCMHAMHVMHGHMGMGIWAWAWACPVHMHDLVQLHHRHAASSPTHSLTY